MSVIHLTWDAWIQIVLIKLLKVGIGVIVVVPDIYHDVETRRNSVGYRSNITRAAEALTADGQLEKAKEILDLGMEKMPLEYFEHYSMIEPFVRGYYDVGATTDAQDLLDRVILKYQDEIDFYKAMPLEEQNKVIQQIITAIERYRGLVRTAIDNDDDKMIAKHFDAFNNYVKQFPRVYNEDELLQMPGATGDQELIELLESEIDNADAERSIEPVVDTVD